LQSCNKFFHCLNLDLNYLYFSGTEKFECSCLVITTFFVWCMGYPEQAVGYFTVLYRYHF
jgi:hypothetical protein